MPVLSDYKVDTRELTRDKLGQFVSDSQLTRWINAARNKVAEVTGCLNCLLTGQASFGSSAQPGSMVAGAIIPGTLPNAAPNATLGAPTNRLTTITGVEQYPFLGLRPFLRAQMAGYGDVIDVFTCSVSWGGASLPALDWRPFDELQAYYRAAYNTSIQMYPSLWSTNGDGVRQNLWLFPIPPQNLVMELNCFCQPAPIYSDTDMEALPDPFTGGVKYYAAYLVYLSSQRMGMAQTMLDLFTSTLGVDRVAADRGKVMTYYDGW